MVLVRVQKRLPESRPEQAQRSSGSPYLQLPELRSACSGLPHEIGKLFLYAYLLATGPSQLVAGVGPENVAVVVNADSKSSTQVADEYVRLRKIPVGNVIRLLDVPDSESIEVEEFRSKLLGPVLEVINDRGLSKQIECVAWSSDFPTAINVKSDIGKSRLPKVLTPVASLNGLTYLYQLVMRKDVRYLSLQVNGYAR